MATSSISSLGLGSSGVLNYDIIDKLRAVDESAHIKPIDTKIATNTTKQSDLTILTTMAATLKASTSTIADEMSYLQRTTTVSNSAISVTAEAGSSIQDFSIHVNTLAKSDIYQSAGFASETSTFSATDDTLNIKMNGTTYSIEVTSATTLSELKGLIADKTDGKLTASVLNTGNSTEPFKLVIKTNQTGVDNMIDFSTTSSALTTALGLDVSANHLQTASNASLIYNGVNISRNANTFDDLIVGVSITLNEEQIDASTVSNVSIKQDLSAVKDSMSTFVSAYNDLMSNLVEATKYDSATKASGTFQNASQVKAFKSELNAQLLKVDDQGRTLADYGIALNSAGLLEFDSKIFDAKIADSTVETENFLRGSSDLTNTSETGFFTDFNGLLASYATDKESIFNLYLNSLKTEKTSLDKNKTLAIEKLDDKYEIMAKRFAAYDSIINKLNNQFSALSQMIQASYNSNK